MTGYGTDDFRKITEVGLINRTGPDAGGSGGMYQNNRRNKDNKAFAHILDAERTNINEGHDISIKNSGYGPKGMPSTVYIQMKDYTFQS